MAAWGSPVEVETRRRIRLSIWAYAYEFLNVSIVSDEEFDREALLVDVKTKTGNKRLDDFFRLHFAAYTGQWVTKHPDLKQLDFTTRRVLAYQGKSHLCD